MRTTTESSQSEIRKHKKKWSPCNRCDIASKHKVFYRGSVPCKYLFVGEAPGPSETVTKLPFTGTAGKVLQSLLNDVGLVDNYGLTNIISCFPYQPDNPSRFRKPSPNEIANCSDRLDEIIEIVMPHFYIALGKVAKKNPVYGIQWHLELDHPSFIARKGGEGSLPYKRNKHKLRRFIDETL